MLENPPFGLDMDINKQTVKKFAESQDYKREKEESKKCSSVEVNNVDAQYLDDREDNVNLKISSVDIGDNILKGNLCRGESLENTINTIKAVENNQEKKELWQVPSGFCLDHEDIIPAVKSSHPKDLEADIQCFTFKNYGDEIVVEVFGKQVTCISCLETFARIDLHLKKK